MSNLSPPRYDRVAIALHWVVAILIAAVGAVGLMFDNVLHPAKAFWLNLHAIFGLVLFGFILARTTWRLTHPAPALPPGTSMITALSAKVLHRLMYLLMLAIPLIGLISFLWHARVFDFGLFRLDPSIAANRAISRPTQTLHAWLTYALIAALALHVLAALWHHFVLRDGLLARMMPRALKGHSPDRGSADAASA